MKKLKRFSLVVITALCAVFLSACGLSGKLPVDMPQASGQGETKIQSENLVVHYLDVGQGDSEFIELPNGETMLIDAGETDKGETVVNDISALGCNKITYLVATHPHSDHIGGMPAVLDAFDVANAYLPNASSSSDIYAEFLDKLDAEGCNVYEAKNDVSVIQTESLCAYFVAPCGTDYKNLNNYSAVLKLVYGETSFLFTGDAQSQSEKEITADVSANVVKVGHHGSKTSSSQAFVSAVSPEYAIIEVGKDNSYGHPNVGVIERWQNAGADVLRTDLNGSITFTSDGSNISYTCEKEG